MSPKVGKQVSKSKGERSVIAHTRITPGTYNRLIYVADESGWTLSTAINAAIENGLDALETALDYQDMYEAQKQVEDNVAKDYEKMEAERRAAREKVAAERVKQLKKQGKL